MALRRGLGWWTLGSFGTDESLAQLAAHEDADDDGAT